MYTTGVYDASVRVIHVGWHGSLVVRASDLRLNGREFDPRQPNYRSVTTGIGDRLRAGIPHHLGM